MDEHLASEKAAGRPGNTRNGYTPKTVVTGSGTEVSLEVRLS
jgi:transposase-like protein